MTNTMKRLAVLLIGTLFVLCVAIVLAVSLPVSTAFAAEGETATDTESEATVHDHNDGTWTELTADGGTLESGNYYLTSDVTLTTDITIADGATVTLCLNGYKLTGTGMNAVITFNEGVDFTLEDCSADASAPAGTGVITGGIGFLDVDSIRRGGGVYISGNSTFTMNGGTISGNTATTGGGVGVDNDGTFTMNGGTISGNTTAKDTGGGVYVRYGTFTLKGGTISDNVAKINGGGVYVAYGTFTMNSGTISGNTAANGGGVYMDGTFTMNGGTISGNTASGNGGGVYVGSSLTMSGGTISDNTASGNGGGVFVYRDGSFTMNNGTISVNSATNGSGVYIDGTFTMKGGTLTDNFASEYGGGVYINDIATFTLEDGTISGNIARYIGGVHVVGIFNMNGGTISGNSASDGGVVRVPGIFTMHGGYFDDTIVSGRVSISGGYLKDESNVAYIVSDHAAHDISAFGTALDSDYIAGFPYAVYANGTAQITANAGIIYDGSPVAAGTDFTVTGADGVEFTYLYKTAGGEFISGLPTNAGEYTVSGYGLNGEKQFFSVEFDITVAKATYDMSNISFADKSVTYDGEEQSLVVSGDLPDGVTVTYEGNGKVNAGEYTVTASFTGDYANYNAIADMTATLTIEKGVPSYTAPTELTVSVGQNVANITLPDGWEWKDGDVQFGTAGEHKAIAVYTAADTANYAPVEVELTVTVSESEPTEPEQPTDPDQPKDPDQSGGEITSEEPEGLSGGAIAGIVIGCILSVLLIEYGVFALLYRKKLISGAFFGKIYPFIKD